MRLFDSHVHLQDPLFGPDPAGVLAAARAAGVGRFACNGSGPGDWPAVIDLAARQAGVVPFLGLHPWEVPAAPDTWAAELETLVAGNRCGVGEIGLDRWKRGLPRPEQEAAFRRQLGIARRFGRPVTVHCLRAWGWLMEVLRDEPSLPRAFLLHAYGGPVELISPLAECGGYFSFALDLLDERRRRKRRAAAAVPADRLLIETDAPDLPPPPAYRRHELRDETGRVRNHPANLPAVVACLAALRGERAEALAERLWENGRRFLEPLLEDGDG